MRRIRTMMAMAAMAVLTMVAVPADAQIGAVPPPDTGFASTGWLELAGTDHIGDGIRRYSTADGMPFKLFWGGVGPQPGALRVWINASDRTADITLVPPQGSDLAVGTYTGATRAAFKEPSEPGFDLSVSPWGCNTLEAEFVVHRIVVNEFHQPEAIDVSFVQHCQDGVPFTRGRLVINYELPGATTPPSGTVASTGFSFLGARSRLVSTAELGLVLGQVERGGNRLAVAGLHGEQTSSLSVSAPDGQVLQPGTYLVPQGPDDGTQPQLSFDDGNNMDCWNASASFTIHQLHHTAVGIVDLLDLSFQRNCSSYAVMYGRILIEVDVPEVTITTTFDDEQFLLRDTYSARVDGIFTCTQAAEVTLLVTLKQGPLNAMAIDQSVKTYQCEPGVPVNWDAQLLSFSANDYTEGAARLEVLAIPAAGGATAHFSGVSRLVLLGPEPLRQTPPREAGTTPRPTVPRRPIPEG